MADTTITDKKDFKVNILNVERFSKLSVNDQKLFEAIRNSILEIFPIIDKKFPDEALKLAENFAFINLETFNVFYDKRIKTEIDALKTQIAAAATPATTTTP